MSEETEAQHPMPLAMTLVLNPNARKLKPLCSGETTPDIEQFREHFRHLLPPNSDIHLTRSLDELDALMSCWQHGERTLCFYGGDGSISQGITSLIRHHGESFELPPVLPVRAGTINMLCNHTGKRESAHRTLEGWVAGTGRQLRKIPTLKVEVEGQAPRYGFVFAWGIGYRVLREYYRRTNTPNALDGVAVATQAFLQAIKPSSEELPLFKRERLGMRIDLGRGPGEPVEAPLHTLTAGTISRITLGIKPFPPGEVAPGGFHFSANGMPLYKVAAFVPVLMFGLGDQSELDFGPELVCGRQAKSLECHLTEGFTLDGEVIELERPSQVRLSAGPVARFWTRR